MSVFTIFWKFVSVLSISPLSSFGKCYPMLPHKQLPVEFQNILSSDDEDENMSRAESSRDDPFVGVETKVTILTEVRGGELITKEVEIQNVERGMMIKTNSGFKSVDYILLADDIMMYNIGIWISLKTPVLVGDDPIWQYPIDMVDDPSKIELRRGCSLVLGGAKCPFASGPFYVSPIVYSRESDSELSYNSKKSRSVLMELDDLDVSGDGIIHVEGIMCDKNGTVSSIII